MADAMSLVPEHASKKARPASAPQLSWLPFHIARSLSMGFGPIDQETMISIYRSREKIHELFTQVVNRVFFLVVTDNLKRQTILAL